MDFVLITGSAGLIGSEAVNFFHNKGFGVIGIDNDMRSYFFGKEASTKSNIDFFKEKYKNYKHYSIDIRNENVIREIFQEYNTDIKCVIHTAAQPSHDWAAKEPFTDFTVNANGTLNILEAARKNCFDATFIFTSTNKVYGDTPNYLPLQELELRYEVQSTHPFYRFGIDETMSIDNSKHSLFGASKLAADILVQEYGKYFGMKTVIFRGGCLTGPAHQGAELHGFLAYLIKCALLNKKYSIYGYKGKQVRDNIHSFDLINAFWCFYEKPRKGEVYNMGGSRHSNISMLEAIAMIRQISGHQLKYEISETNRIGDHIWYISDVRKFQNHYPSFSYSYDMERIMKEMLMTAEKSL